MGSLDPHLSSQSPPSILSCRWYIILPELHVVLLWSQEMLEYVENGKLAKEGGAASVQPWGSRQRCCFGVPHTPVRSPSRMLPKVNELIGFKVGFGWGCALVC